MITIVSSLPRAVFILFPLIAALWVQPVWSMTFGAIRLQDGTTAIRGEGQIGPGDAERLRAVAHRATVGPYGERILILDSVGGEVIDAIRTAEVIDEFRFMTVVAWGDKCLSACASVLYFSGDARMVLGDGILGFHNCTPQSSTGAPLSPARCNANIARFIGTQGYVPDFLFTMLSSQPVRSIEIDGQSEPFSIAQPDIHCFGIQQPPWLPHNGSSATPCMQLATTGTVTSAKDWDQPQAGPETIPAQVPAALFAFKWSPPGGWSYGFAKDAATLGFRRRDHFPAGPEIEIFCAVAAPGSWVVLLRRLVSPDVRKAEHLAFRTRTGVASAKATTRTLPVGGLGRSRFQIVLESYVFTSDLARLLSGPDGPGEFVLLDAAGRPLDTIAVDVAGARARLPNLSNNCAGRFPGAN